MNSYYCERIDLNFWSEPLNAFTNLGFIIISYIIFKNYKNQKYIKAYAFIIFLIGTSSFLFHTIPNKFTGFLDVISILIFIILFTFDIYKNLTSQTLSIIITFTSIASYTIFGNIFKYSILGSSAFYFLIVIHLYLIFLILTLLKLKNRSYILIAALLFTMSIFFRIMDQKVCHFLQHGTHFIWHILNSITLLYCIKALISLRKLVKTTSPKIPSKP